MVDGDVTDPTRPDTGIPPLRIGDLTVPLPIVCAPMAGGPTTPALVAEVGAAGGLGMLAAGYLGASAVAGLLDDVEGRTHRPYGVNLFLSGPDPLADDPTGLRARALADYRSELAADARHGAVPGEPRWSDEEVADKIAVLAAHRPALVSVTFGDPGGALVARIHGDVGVPVAVTVTSLVEAGAAIGSGADALIVQGIEAGGHRGLWTDDPAQVAGGPRVPTADLVRIIGAAVDVPVIAAGGVTDGAAIRSMMSLGAAAAQLGTAFLCCDEAGTSAPHRHALLDRTFSDTVITRAFSGRSARSLRNDFATRHTAAPALYPHVHHLTKPLRAAATAADDPDGINLWAGTGWRAVTEGPAADLMARLTAELIDGP
ncbi:nitronate monooxygenase [Gordonia sp. ABSL11-1]|uniref:NAD(P)H-dependent flavin oxidoreductase n=1 Tax=Gordonia sp. ABSL11-1 TaxID=3053924 RepID=UPI0025722460|nr:nitronate monooxygenase [Gordonia sp. ABSL11-1]MDL9944704.1 nitronate monooxygenase [Gordonia sp. ABSL11-1]